MFLGWGRACAVSGPFHRAHPRKFRVTRLSPRGLEGAGQRSRSTGLRCDSGKHGEGLSFSGFGTDSHLVDQVALGTAAEGLHSAHVCVVCDLEGSEWETLSLSRVEPLLGLRLSVFHKHQFGCASQCACWEMSCHLAGPREVSDWALHGQHPSDELPRSIARSCRVEGQTSIPARQASPD